VGLKSFPDNFEFEVECIGILFLDHQKSHTDTRAVHNMGILYIKKDVLSKKTNWIPFALFSLFFAPNHDYYLYIKNDRLLMRYSVRSYIYRLIDF
jgi:hypothetical protein